MDATAPSVAPSQPVSRAARAGSTPRDSQPPRPKGPSSRFPTPLLPGKSLPPLLRPTTRAWWQGTKGPSVLSVEHSEQRSRAGSQVTSCLGTHIPAGPPPPGGNQLHRLSSPCWAPARDARKSRGGSPGRRKPYMLPRGPRGLVYDDSPCFCVDLCNFHGVFRTVSTGSSSAEPSLCAWPCASPVTPTRTGWAVLYTRHRLVLTVAPLRRWRQ